MKDKIFIAIQHVEGSYSERWISYCDRNNYNYKLVDVFKPDIIQQLHGCSFFLWNFQLAYLKDLLFAKQLIFSIEKMGIKVFPNTNTSWHYDDKIGQKYLLESINVPFVETLVFYEKESALEWARLSCFPTVFKLRGGASSNNVKLINSKNDAIKHINKAFSVGFNSKPFSFRLKESWNKFRVYKTLDNFIGTIAGLKNYWFPTEQQKLNSVIEKGYLYIQEFLPHNDFDIRIFVVGERAFGIKRMVRDNDFRASGSGKVLFDKEEVDIRCVKISFEVSKKLCAQSIAFDFVFDKKNQPKIIEISYCSVTGGYDKCEGYWDSQLKWHNGRKNVENLMIEDLLNS